MSNTKSLNDKQLLMNIADMVVRNPAYAKDLFSNMHEIVGLYPELQGIGSLLDTYNSDQYHQSLKYVVDGISDVDSKKIFTLALEDSDNYQDDSYSGQLAAG
jgi:hypothetical protein